MEPRFDPGGTFEICRACTPIECAVDTLSGCVHQQHCVAQLIQLNRTPTGASPSKGQEEFGSDREDWRGHHQKAARIALKSNLHASIISREAGVTGIGHDNPPAVVLGWTGDG